MIAQELEVSLHMAFVDARQQRQDFITVEHLLMALLDSDLGELLPAAAKGELAGHQARWKPGAAAVVVVAAGNCAGQHRGLLGDCH
jgi:ATP-dependent Clp protease ATP-binding subunit ClpA